MKDQRAVEAILHKQYPEAEQRTLAAEFLGWAVCQADAYGTHLWAVYAASDRVRLVFGSLIVCTLYAEKVWLALDKQTLENEESLRDRLDQSEHWSWDEDGFPEYKPVESKNGFFDPRKIEAELMQHIKLLHDRFLEKGSRYYNRLNRQSQAKHDPAVLDALVSITGSPLPSPEYDIRASADTLETDTPGDPGGTDKTAASTETTSKAIQRRGQERFRTSLKCYWRNACAVTGLANPSLLIASHIKPWNKANNEERLDPFNGLLLCPNLDAAFDSGLISFKDDGRLLISNQLNPEDQAALGVDSAASLRFIDERHQQYLWYHRNHVFKGENPSLAGE